MRWQPGEVVLWRETWRDKTWLAMPVRVVKETHHQIAVYLAEGTQFLFPPGGWPFDGPHPWADRGAWTGHGVLVVHRQGSAHAVWHFWEGAERHFAGWYVNLQAPFRRDDQAFDTVDHELDLWIRADGSWQWKDDERMDNWVRQGRFTREEVDAMRVEGERVLAKWPFPTGWEDWRPDPTWSVPDPPPGIPPFGLP